MMLQIFRSNNTNYQSKILTINKLLETATVGKYTNEAID